MNYMSVDDIMAAGVTNAEHLRNNTKQDNDADTIDGAAWLTYAGVACEHVYVSGNSWIGLGTTAEDLKVNRRDAAMWDLWREEGTLYGDINFIRLRWGGYTQASSTATSRKLVYDVLFFSTGDIMLHVETVATSYYTGTFTLGSLTYTKPTAASPYVTFYLQPDGTYTVAYEQISIPIPYIYGYLVRDGESVYTVADGALVPVTLEPGKRDAPGKTIRAELWVGKDTDALNITYSGEFPNSRSYVIPLVAGEEYTIAMLDLSDRFRATTCEFNPLDIVYNETKYGIRSLAFVNNPSTLQNVTFTAGGNEHYLVLQVSNTSQEPEVSATYAISPLVNAFINYGAASLPSGSLLLGLTSPEVLYWHDSTADLPTMHAEISGVPRPQYVISDSIDLTNETILGIQGVVAEEAGAPLYAVAFDDGEFMTYTDSWVTTDTGMSSSMLSAITEAQWAEAIAGVSAIKLRALLQTTTDAITSVYFDFKNPDE